MTPLRIGTWNVEHASLSKNPRRLDVLRAADADVWILTETRDALDLGSTHSPVHSDLRQRHMRDGERWVSIWSRVRIIGRVRVQDASRTVAALFDTPIGALLVYGTVLPWHSDRGPHGTARFWTEHHRVLPLQTAEWCSLRRRYAEAELCVAGDLNMNLGGRHHYGTRHGRELLRAGLELAGLECVTRTESVPTGKLSSALIDHICLPKAWTARVRVANAWPGILDGLRLSDHNGVVVAIHRSARTRKTIIGA